MVKYTSRDADLQTAGRRRRIDSYIRVMHWLPGTVIYEGLTLVTMPHSGKVAIVTGSSRGIGKAIALQLAADGADVAVCARSERSTDSLPGSIVETAEAVGALGRRAIAIRVDVTSDPDVRHMVERVMGYFGRVDILVNNAALAGLAGPGKPFIESDAGLLDLFYRTNVRAPFLISSLVAAQMTSSGGGAIVNISSRMGRMPAGLRQSPAHRGVNMGYAITKAALDRFSAAIAEELLSARIGVITVYPSLTYIERLAGRKDIDWTGADSPEVTALAVSHVCREPMAHTGRVLSARDVVSQFGLHQKTIKKSPQM